MLQTHAQEMWEKSQAENVTQTVHSEEEFSARVQSEKQINEDSTPPNRAYLWKPNRRTCKATRFYEHSLARKSTEMLDQGHGLWQQLLTHALAHYVEESQEHYAQYPATLKKKLAQPKLAIPSREIGASKKLHCKTYNGNFRS